MGGRTTARVQDHHTEGCECSATAVLDALGDEDVRSLFMCADSPQTVQEFANNCRIPVSTVYRKIEQLFEAGLLVQTIRFSDHARHPAVYERSVDSITLSMTPEFTVDCEPRSLTIDSAEEREIA